MQQLDMFDETLEKKIYRMELWIMRLHRELAFLKTVYYMRHDKKTVSLTSAQPDMFGT
jgi:hypothetical protein